MTDPTPPPPTPKPKCVLLGATRGCGLETLLALVEKGHPSYVLARDPPAFAETLAARGATNPLITVVQGDALQARDLERLFATAGPQDVGFVLFSIGGKPTFKNPLSPKLSPPQICTRAMAVFLPVFTQQFADPAAQPRLVVVSSNGIGARAHAQLPLPLRPIYSWLLREPHADKEAMERAVCAAAGIVHEDFNPAAAVGAQRTLGNVVVVRPSLLVDGAATGAVRAGESVAGAWTVRRGDVGGFVAGECAAGVDTWRGRGVVVAG